MDRITIPKFDNLEDLFEFLVENKAALKAEKKYNVKHSDPLLYSGANVAIKAGGVNLSDADTIQVKSVINTTNIMDSHNDVHLPKIWNKSLREKKDFYLLEEHQMSFKTIISDKVKARVENISFKDLGFSKLKGESQALIFDSELKRDRNPFMFEQYAKGHVKNHSVGMQYVSLDLAVNSEDYPEEFETWNKHIDSVANRKDAEKNGFFWAVTEAKIIEGSAVPMGSNHVTPTLTVEAKNEDNGPSSDTQAEPRMSTLKRGFI